MQAVSKEHAPVVRKIIAGARDLLSDEGKWIKNYLAINAAREDVAVHAPDACMWCALGGLCRECRAKGVDMDSEQYRDVMRHVTHHVRLYTGERDALLAMWNDCDDTKHRDVLAVFDSAIAELS